MVEQYVSDQYNQFYRLIRVSGDKGTGLYIPGDPWNNVVNGHDYDAENCTPTSAAALWEAHTLGKERTTPNAIRNHQGDFKGGIGWDDVNDAYWSLFGERLTIPVADFSDFVSAVKVRAVGWQGDYGQIPWTYQAQKGGNFPHAFVAFKWRPSDGRILVMDTLARRMAWWPQYVIRQSAEHLAIRERGTRSRLFLMYSRTTAIVTPPPPHGWTVSIHPLPGADKRYFLRYILDKTNTYIVDRERVGTGGFSAHSTAPVTRKVLSTKRSEFEKDEYRLVKINDDKSAYDQWWVAAGWAQEV